MLRAARNSSIRPGGEDVVLRVSLCRVVQIRYRGTARRGLSQLSLTFTDWHDRKHWLCVRSTPHGLGKGTHRFSVHAVDGAASIDASVMVPSVTVGTTAPYGMAGAAPTVITCKYGMVCCVCML